MRQSGTLDQILQVRPEVSSLISFSSSARDARTPSRDSLGQKVPQVDKVAVPLILDIDHSPPGLSSPDGFTIDVDVALGTDDGKGDHGLRDRMYPMSAQVAKKYSQAEIDQERTRIRSFKLSSSSSCSSVSKGYSRIWW